MARPEQHATCTCAMAEGTSEAQLVKVSLVCPCKGVQFEILCDEFLFFSNFECPVCTCTHWVRT